MSTASLSFLAEPAPGTSLALFGKHPLVADHLEDINLASSSLVAFKQGLYIEGIGECLSRQVWFKDLGQTDSIPYDHNLLCLGPTGLLVARLVHSEDAVGRKQYPLVLALHTGELSLLHEVGLMAAAFETTLEKLRVAADLTALRQTLADAERQLSEIRQSASAKAPPNSSARESWLQHLPPGGGNREGIFRCCHALLPEGAGAGRARLPIHSSVSWPSITLWASFLRQLCGSKPCISFLWRRGRPFADIWLSPPGARALASIFADEAAQPLTTQVPFTVPDNIRQQAQSALESWLSQESLFPAPQAVEGRPNLFNKVRQEIIDWIK
ncbi:hypothetical protein [Prosthecobacter sp.]|uniref:hypothetical protein n=1 Tax=Prosthecobacter sp. TaxID=1965333 RepID=UPI003784081F